MGNILYKIASSIDSNVVALAVIALFGAALELLLAKLTGPAFASSLVLQVLLFLAIALSAFFFGLIGCPGSGCFVIGLLVFGAMFLVAALGFAGALVWSLGQMWWYLLVPVIAIPALAYTLSFTLTVHNDLATPPDISAWLKRFKPMDTEAK